MRQSRGAMLSMWLRWEEDAHSEYLPACRKWPCFELRSKDFAQENRY